MLLLKHVALYHFGHLTKICPTGTGALQKKYERRYLGYIEAPGTNMEQCIIRNLYHNMLKEETIVDKISMKTRTEIEAFLSEKDDKKENMEYEKYRDELFLAASAAEENGFVKGFVYAFRLFTECNME